MDKRRTDDSRPELAAWKGANADKFRKAWEEFKPSLDKLQSVLQEGRAEKGLPLEELLRLSAADAEDAVRLLRAARRVQARNGSVAAAGLLQTMTEAKIELIPPASVEQARRLADLRAALLTTPAYSYETLAKARGDARASTTRTWVSRARESGRLFTVKFDGRTVIPAFQLTDSGSTRNEYATVLSLLLDSEIDGWAIWTWLTNPTPLLSGGVPADLLSEAPDRVVTAARRFASSRRSAA